MNNTIDNPKMNARLRARTRTWSLVVRGVVYIANHDATHGVGRVIGRTRWTNLVTEAESAARDLAKRHGIEIDGNYCCGTTEFAK